ERPLVPRPSGTLLSYQRRLVENGLTTGVVGTPSKEKGTMARRITAFLVGLLLVSAGAGAQERFGSLAGTVIDTTKAAVTGATVTATNKETNAQRVVVTGSDGSYRVP